MSETLNGQEVFENIEEKLSNAEIEKDYSITEQELLGKTIKSTEIYESLNNEQKKISKEEKEMRRKAIANGIALNALGGGPEPTGIALEMYEKYIEGEFTFEELEHQLIKMFIKVDKL